MRPVSIYTCPSRNAVVYQTENTRAVLLNGDLTLAQCEKRDPMGFWLPWDIPAAAIEIIALVTTELNRREPRT